MSNMSVSLLRPGQRRAIRAKPVKQHHTHAQSGLPAILRRSDCACGGGCVSCRSDASMAGPEHPAEREAEAVADKVVSMPEPPALSLADAGTGAAVQLMGEGDEAVQAQPMEEEEEMLQAQPMEEEEEMLQAQPMEEEEEMLQARAGGKLAAAESPAARRATQGLGPGRPISTDTRTFFERRMGADFTSVRVHDGPDAAAKASGIGAQAYTYGRNIVFNTGRFNPSSTKGRHLLAHELTHVVQQTGAGPAVQAKGTSFGGFFRNLFPFGDYARETLSEYLSVLRTTNDIVDDLDSDNMARQIAEEWAEDRQSHDLSPRIRVLLIREMLSGFVAPSDQEGIINILESSTNPELEAIVGDSPTRISFPDIYREFGRWRQRLELFQARVLSRLGSFKHAPAKGEPLLDSLEENEQEYGLRFEEASLSFRLKSASLLESFLVDISVPEGGSHVTLSLTRDALRISLSPGIEIDIIGPVNESLQNVRFGFKGLRPQIGLTRYSGAATKAAAAKIHDLLKGTRFADPAYDFRRDPNLMAEIRDNSIIGDIERVKYNLEKTAEVDDDDKDKDDMIGLEEGLGLISGVGGSLSLTHPKARRFPEKDEGYGLLIPAGTSFSIRLDVAGRGDELRNRDAKLEGLLVSSSGLFVVKDSERLVSIRGFDLKPGFQIEFRDFQELKDLTPHVREALPEFMSDTVGDALDAANQIKSGMEAVGDFLDALGGAPTQHKRRASVTASLLESLAEVYLGMEVRSLARTFREPLRKYSGMSDEQIDVFFGK